MGSIVSPIQAVSINEPMIIDNQNNLKNIFRGRIKSKYLPNNKKKLFSFKFLHPNCNDCNVRTLMDKKFKKNLNDKILDNIK